MLYSFWYIQNNLQLSVVLEVPSEKNPTHQHLKCLKPKQFENGKHESVGAHYCVAIIGSNLIVFCVRVCVVPGKGRSVFYLQWLLFKKKKAK